MVGTMAWHNIKSDYLEKVLKNYSDLSGDLHLVELQREEANVGLGLSLVGNRDLGTMSVFVVGIWPGSVAASSGLIRVGDELLEVNGHVLFSRSHLNASAIIKSISCDHVRILLIRSLDFTDRMALSPLRLPPVAYKNSSNTLIPKKPKSLSLDEVPASDHMHRHSDILQRQLATTEPSPNGNNIDNECIERNNTATTVVRVNGSMRSDKQRTEDGSPPNKELAATPLNAASVTIEKETMTSPAFLPVISGPLQNKSRRLQKSAQVEEPDEEPKTSTSTLEMERVTLKFTEPQLKSEAVKPFEVVASGVSTEWNHCPLEEISPETSTDSSSPLHPFESDILEDPSTCSIASGRSNTIEIRKGKLGLGLRVVGGSDTVLKAIIVYEIYRNGAAAKDGRLWPGDKILEVNDQDLREATHSRAVQVLRQVTATVKMVVFRDEANHRDDELYEAVTVELMKKPGKGLGLSITACRDNAGVLISDVVKGGVADADGRLLPGDQILAVNGDDLRTVTQDYAAELLKMSMGKIILRIGRLKVVSRQNSSRNSGSSFSRSGMTKSDSSTSSCKRQAHKIVVRTVGC